MDARNRIDKLARMIPAAHDDPTVADVLGDDPRALGWVLDLMNPAPLPEQAREAALRLHARLSPTPTLLAHLAALSPSVPIE